MSFDPGKSELQLDGRGLRIGLIAACYNQERVDQLIRLVAAELERLGVDSAAIELARVPGSMEIPHAAALFAKRGNLDALIGLGIVIAGDTSHHEVIGNTTASSLQQISMKTGIPVINGILVVDTEEQASDRLGGKVDRGAEFARAAIGLANLNV